jgi:hypothetical protein
MKTMTTKKVETKKMSKKITVLNTFRIEKAVQKAQSEGEGEGYVKKSNVFHCTAMTELPIEKYAYVDGEYQICKVIHANDCWLNVTEKSRLPLTNTHNIYDVNNNLGSAYNFVKVGSTTECDIEIDESEEKIINKVNSGHISSVSIGGKNISSILISKGTEANVLGKTYKATDTPVIVVTKAEPWELALCQVGADSNAKITKNQEESEFYDENLFKKTKEIKMKAEEGKIENTVAKTVPVEPVKTETEPAKVEKAAETPVIDDFAEVNKALDIENKRVELIKTVCKNRGFSPEIEESFVKSGKNINELKQDIIIETRNILQKGVVNPMVETTKSEVENVIAGASLAFQKMILGDKMSEENEVLLRKSVVKPNYDSIIEAMAKMANINTYASTQKIVQTVMKDAQASSAFTTMLNAAINGAYEALVLSGDVADLSFVGEVPVDTVGRPFLLTDVDIIGDLPEIEEGEPYTQHLITTCGNTITNKRYGMYELLTIEAMINDRAAFSMLGNRQGKILEAHARKDETLVTKIFADNGNLADGKALFSADHSNLVNLPLTAENLDLVRQVAVAMVDANEVRIGTEPRFLVVPRALKKKAMEIVMNPEYVNYNINKDLKVIVLNGLSDDNAWYLVGPQNYGVILSYLPTYGKAPVISTFVSQGSDAEGVGIKNFRFVGSGVKSHYYMVKSTGVSATTEA